MWWFFTFRAVRAPRRLTTKYQQEAIYIAGIEIIGTSGLEVKAVILQKTHDKTNSLMITC